MSHNNIELSVLHDRASYQIEDLESEIRADKHCSQLLKDFHQRLLVEHKTKPLEAGSQAAGADYFLREFMIGRCRQNIFDADATRVRQFAGNWYIISNLEPNMAELDSMLDGISAFYQYCAEHKLASQSTVQEIQRACTERDFYRRRIEEFHNISGDGYVGWEQDCPL